ncbi:hypothetical protein GGS21DRAFT_308059 [Xylaria nigripes]|nr:hypothetical protein GGS21DRAFT_308059 [Xylaria nigripes]
MIHFSYNIQAKDLAIRRVPLSLPDLKPIGRRDSAFYDPVQLPKTIFKKTAEGIEKTLDECLTGVYATPLPRHHAGFKLEASHWQFQLEASIYGRAASVIVCGFLRPTKPSTNLGGTRVQRPPFFNRFILIEVLHESRTRSTYKLARQSSQYLRGNEVAYRTPAFTIPTYPSREYSQTGAFGNCTKSCLRGGIYGFIQVKEPRM